MGYIMNQDGSTGHDWCKNRNAKKAKGASGRTAGGTKGAACQATPLERYMAKRNRSYKHPLYSAWSETHTGKK